MVGPDRRMVASANTLRVASLALAIIGLSVSPSVAQSIVDTGLNYAGSGVAAVGSGIGSGIDGIIAAFEGAVAGVSSRLIPIARTLMGSLLLIELVLTIGKIVVKGGDLGELFTALMQRILIAGFYLFLMSSLPGSGGLNTLVGASAEALAGAGGAAVRPSELISNSISTAGVLLGEATIYQIVPVALICIALVVITSIIAAMIVVAYVEIHVVFGLGVIALGFSGSSLTEGVARGYLMAAIGKCLKLFSMLVLSSVFGSVFQSLGAGLLAGEAVGDMIISALALMAGCLIMLMIVVSVPSALESAVSGGRSGGSSAAESIGSAARGTGMKGAGKALGGSASLAGAGVGLGAKGVAKGIGMGASAAGSAMKARVSAALGKDS